MSAAQETTERERRPWSRKLTPAQIRAVINKYHGGSNVREIMAEFRIGRTSLYRYIHDYDKMPEATTDIGWWRIETQRLKEVCVSLALENKALKERLSAQTA